MRAPPMPLPKKRVLAGRSASLPSQTAVPGVQLQEKEPGKPPTPQESEARLRGEYASLAEQHIATIDEALTSGYIWWFEKQFFSGKTEQQTTSLEERSEARAALPATSGTSSRRSIPESGTGSGSAHRQASRSMSF